MRFKKYKITLFLIISALNVNAQDDDVTVINGVSVPSDFPYIEVTLREETAPGKIFIANRWDSPYIMILENDGSPYFYKRLPWPTVNFQLHPTGTLTMWQGDPINNFVELDSNYNVIDILKGGPGYHIDVHEIQLLPNGNYLVIVWINRGKDMSQVVEGGKVDATLKENIVQELDRNRNVLFEWRSWDHFNVLDAVHEDPTANTIDYVHMNAIAVDYDGHLLISSRSLSEITKINRQTGEIIWRLGGENNQFQFINDEYGFSYQHDIRPVPGKPNQYTLFDNGNHRSPLFSRALELKLDTLNWTATKVWEYRHDPDRYAGAWGNVQRLPNGNTLINWSFNNLPKATEVTPEGEIVYEMNFIDQTRSNCYRTFRFDWESHVDVPYLIAEPHFDKVTLIFNKFGDKSVTEYRIYGGKNPNSDELLAITSEPFIYLSVLENHQIYYFRVTAVDSNGIESDFSNEECIFVNFSEPAENLILNGNFSKDADYWQLDISNSASAQGFVEDGIYHIQIDTGGVWDSDIQLHQDNLEIIENREYILEFDAWSSNPKIFSLKVRKSSDPFTDYSKIAAVYSTTEQQHFTYEFTMDHITDYSAQIVFECGQSAAEIFIDNVSLILEKTETSHPVLPANFKLFANYPNPFNPITTIRYMLTEKTDITIDLINLRGQKVKEVLSEKKEAGFYEVLVNLEDLESGMVLCRLRAGHFMQVRKMLLLK